MTDNMATKTIILLVALMTCASAENYYYPDHEFDRTPFGDSIDKASMKLLKKAYSTAEDKNVVTSPLGVFALLSLYSAGAPGRIRDEIIQYLGASNYTQLSNEYSGLTEKFSKIDSNSLTIANRIYVSKNYELQSTGAFFESANRMHTDVESADFSHPRDVAKSINTWADQTTHGHITAPVKEDDLNEGVALALFNIIYMQGHWNIPFKAEKTKEEDFHLFDKTTIKIPMMHLKDTFFFFENKDLGYKMLELPYQEKGFRMVVVLPNQIDGLPDLVEKAEQGLLADVFNLAPSTGEINLHMPKFEIKSSLNLNSILPEVGVSSIFTEGASDIVKNSAVKVSKAFQEAFVKVDEEGATAGAFTGDIIVPPSASYVPPPPMEYKVDHPFLFLILHEDKILFIGTYTH